MSTLPSENPAYYRIVAYPKLGYRSYEMELRHDHPNSPPTWHPVGVFGTSIDEIRAQLTAMLTACDVPNR